MALLIIAFFGVILIGLSQVYSASLPAVFVRADPPFRKSGLPLLSGMALTIPVLSALAMAGGAWSGSRFLAYTA